jgi:hypothetical protein
MANGEAAADASFAIRYSLFAIRYSLFAIRSAVQHSAASKGAMRIAISL